LAVIVKDKIRIVLEFFINYIVDRLILWPLYYPIIFFIKKVNTSKSVEQNGVTLLALNVGRFRGDLEVLANSGFVVYKMPYSWQTRIFYAYRDRSKDTFLNPKKNSEIYNDRIRVRRYLSKLMESLVKKKNIDCVISAGLFYNQDFDWGAASKSIGVPYIVFHRENLVVSRHLRTHYTKRAKFLKKIGFVGSFIVFQNKVVKSIFDEHSGVNNNNIFALGSLRMDEYINKIRKKINYKNSNKITLFSFPPSNAILSNCYSDNFGWFSLHDKVHKSFIELAYENPDIDFVIKHKGVNWHITEKLLNNLNIDNIDNLYIHDESYDAQDLLLSSDVISGFCSTSLLEAAIANKPVIYPVFAEANDIKYEDFVCFDNASDIFRVARSKEEFKSMIIDSYNNPKISENMKKRRELQFEEQVSFISANSSKKYSEFLINACK